MTVSLNHYLVLSAMLFCIGVAGVLTRKNAIIILASGALGDAILHRRGRGFNPQERHHYLSLHRTDAERGQPGFCGLRPALGGRRRPDIRLLLARCRRCGSGGGIGDYRGSVPAQGDGGY